MHKRSTSTISNLPFLDDISSSNFKFMREQSCSTTNSFVESRADHEKTAAAHQISMEEEEGDDSPKLHIVMMPWLAIGHANPFFELSKRLAQMGHRVSFLSTPGILRRLPLLPPPLSQFVDLLPCPLPLTENLPPSVESTLDLPSDDLRPILMQAYSSSFENHLADFLNDQSRRKPDWIIYDIFSNGWVCDLAARRGVACAYFALINAAVMSILSRLDTPEKLMGVPDWIPFPTNVIFRPFEARKLLSDIPKEAATRSEGPWWGKCNFMAIRTCNEFEPEWLDLLRNLHDGLPIIPIGFLPPSSAGDDETCESWLRMAGWLDRRDPGSVIFAAFGSEVQLTREQIEEIGRGLEQSGLPFVWALRAGTVAAGFEERVRRRGMVVKEWVPQSRLLAHPSVGGFLTHGGWNSVVEGLSAGVALAVLPMQFEQGLNARHLVERGLAVEIVRDYEDGSFSGDEIRRKLRMAMVGEEGEGFRRKGRGIFGNEKIEVHSLKELVKYMLENKISN
ncbi:UDP-glycosyltransferase 91C1 [Platanthera guangdongensis]|uniref:UDP-glycosyltransferase 91C1 n=1 Tax=Platanthera guangdongensis TaxID=2320717 RepID=A0ABR2LP18_9ASPA